jgi:hypothetical protein
LFVYLLGFTCMGYFIGKSAKLDCSRNWNSGSSRNNTRYCNDMKTKKQIVRNAK